MTTYVNLFGGPGSGKSTTAAGVFFYMKIAGINCEYIQEFAKDLSWARSFDSLASQSLVFGEQNFRQERVQNKVSYAVTDSPLLLSLIYKPEGYSDRMNEFVLEQYNKYDNINIYLNRKKNYNPSGRNQSEFEAKQLDVKIKKLLLDYEIPFSEIDGTKEAVRNILELLGIKWTKI